jgi:hypothetical protein
MTAEINWAGVHFGSRQEKDTGEKRKGAAPPPPRLQPDNIINKTLFIGLSHPISVVLKLLEIGRTSSSSNYVFRKSAQIFHVIKYNPAKSMPRKSYKTVGLLNFT